MCVCVCVEGGSVSAHRSKVSREVSYILSIVHMHFVWSTQRSRINISAASTYGSEHCYFISSISLRTLSMHTGLFITMRHSITSSYPPHTYHNCYQDCALKNSLQGNSGIRWIIPHKAVYIHRLFYIKLCTFTDYSTLRCIHSQIILHKAVYIHKLFCIKLCTFTDYSA